VTASASWAFGDQGAGGMGIPIGKPLHSLRRHTSVGDFSGSSMSGQQQERLARFYGLSRHERIRGAEYDSFVEAFVDAVPALAERLAGRIERKCGPAAGTLSRPALHVQRRHPRHGRRCNSQL
jgi:hypothetical protein